MSCRECKFFKSPGGVFGECRRFPPTVSMHGNAMFPRVMSNSEKCGEFKSNPKDKITTTIKGVNTK
ncbi:MAG: hypothetical protein IJC21_08900 [Lentisphaeria bacterium]|nr:hypothetical protein [Lentisphaeria bacterium]